MRKVIAIVDDEKEMEFIYPLIFKEQLEKSQLEINFFHDSSTFLDWIQYHHPDLCMIDIEMPKINGPEIIRTAGVQKRKIPTYFVSGHCPSDFKTEIQELNISRFLSKPFNIRELLSSVKMDLNLNCPT